MQDCIFCKIIRGEIPRTLEYEDGAVVAFKDKNPSAPVHILIVPKKHLSKLADSGIEDVELLGKLQLAAVAVAKKFGIGDGFKLTTNNGAKVGQAVFHLHYHLLGGTKPASAKASAGEEGGDI